MRTIKQTGQFKRDFKREAKSKHKKTLADDFKTALSFLLTDADLPPKYFDHTMIGNWNDHRNCHIKPNYLKIIVYKYSIANYFQFKFSLRCDTAQSRK